MVSDILVKVGADITDFSRKMAESKGRLNDFTQANNDTFSAFRKTGAVITGAGTALAGGLLFAVNKAKDFESGMSKVAAISGATGDDFIALSEKAREMGAQTSFSATDAADGLQYMALAGWDTQQMLGGIEPILHLAEAGALDLGRASDLVTDSMSALGVQVGDLDGYLDKVAKTSASANTDIDALMEAFVIAGGTFKRFNVPLSEANAFLGVMANRGFKGSEAGTAVNAIMTRLTASTGPAAKALKGIGVNAFDSSGKFRGMETVMKDVAKKLSTMTDKEKAHYQSQIAGLDHGKAFEAMLGGLGEEYDTLKGKIVDSDGALKTMRDTMKDNLQGALENLGSAFEEIAISVGTALLPAVKAIVAFVQGLADKFNALSGTTKTVIAVVLAVAAGFMLIVGPILMLIGFIPMLVIGFEMVATVFAAISWPIVAVVAGIMAFIAAIVLAYNNVDWFKTAVDAAWQFIKNATTVVFEAVKAAILVALEYIKGLWETHGPAIIAVATMIWNTILSVINSVTSFIKEIVQLVLQKISDFWSKHGEFIMGVVKATWNDIKTIITTAINIVKSVITLVLGVIKSVFQAVWPAISNIVKIAWELIKTVVKTAIALVAGIIDLTMSLIKGDWEGAWNTIKGVAKEIWSNIEGFFKSIDLVQIGKDIIGGLIKGIGSMVSSVTKAVTNIGSSIKSGFTSFFKIKSPSRVMASLAKHLPGGIIRGMDSMDGKVRAATARLSDSLVPEIPQVSMDYATPSGSHRTMTAAVKSEVAVSQRDSALLGEISALRRDLTNLRVDMDGQTVGRITAPTVGRELSGQTASTIRGQGRRRI